MDLRGENTQIPHPEWVPDTSQKNILIPYPKYLPDASQKKCADSIPGVPAGSINFRLRPGMEYA